MKKFHNFQQTPPFNPPQMFYTTQRRRRRWWRRGQKIRHCFCMFCVCVCERNSAQKIQFPQIFRSFFFFRLSRFLMFTDVIVSTGRLSGSCMFWGRNLLWKFFLYYYFTISTNFEIWDEICWISFLFWVSTIEDGCDFLLRGHGPD